MKTRVLALLVLCVFQIPGFSQDGCSEEYFKILGSLFEDEQGYSLAASLDEQFVYVGGSKDGEAIILKMSSLGVLEWTRTFDIVPNEPDIIFRILVDSEGMIGVSGIAGSQNGGGTVFVFRYNPFSNTVLWAVELISTSVNYNMGMIQLGPGGNYLVTNNPSSPNVAELVMINRVSGAVMPVFSKHYDLGSSETMYDMVLDGGSLYASGRFSDGGGQAQMRNTLLKLDPSNGNVDWMKLGHKPASQAMRVYGVDLVIAQNDIFSIYMGDETGTNLNTDTEVFVQRTGLDGSLIWLKHYQLPGDNNWVDEIIESQGGLVILGRNRVSPSDLFLFKIDYDGNVQWAKQFDYAVNDNAAFLGSIQSQLIEADNHLYFTAFAAGSSNNDLILVKTDLDGEVGSGCVESTTISIPVTDVTNPTFYTQTPIVTDYEPQQIVHSVEAGTDISIQSNTICSTPIFFETQIDMAICNGEAYEGYTIEGMYQDTFQTQNGCDSIRILMLTVETSKVALLDADICEGTAYEGYTQGGIYQDTFQAMGGCDSIRVITLTVHNNDATSIETEICNGKSYEGYSMEGVYQDTFQNIYGCDSIRNLVLTTVPPPLTNVFGKLCDGELYGHFTEGVYVDTFMSVNGCDSIRTLYLENASIYIPNTFSPNNDGINDLFEITVSDEQILNDVYFAIFDRYGNMAYETYSWPIRWTGVGKRGIEYNPGVFTYYMTYLCQEVKILLKGDITLLR